MITLQIKCVVADDKKQAFESMIQRVYRPALAKQQGFVGYRLLREYSVAEREKIGATSEGYTFILELTFETEQQRVKWVASPEHDPAFAEVKKLAGPIIHNGYYLIQDSLRA